ncbi:hypothetical protein ONZ51_g13536 [Trametes cubensis]|uniref:BTB domain-containing protein n=1 Tax=Trametes cubensis TaxID=1111947 RepID=A0AAD7TE06_9APHY|nr:hypothetical protein ONZ51_g13536 [Trametes cubensis]
MEARPNESTTSQASEPSVGQKRERPQDEQSPDLDVAKRRLQIISGTPARVEASPAYAQSADFWYPDGNIVIIVENTGFKLLLSRIKQYCKLFQNEIPAEGDGTSDACSLPQIVSYTLTGVKVADFTEFLRAMETPLYVRPVYDLILLPEISMFG